MWNGARTISAKTNSNKKQPSAPEAPTVIVAVNTEITSYYVGVSSIIITSLLVLTLN